MSQQVILEEGCSVSVHTRIKDLCKAARNRKGLTNQEIADKISERFGIESFPVNTVNNFFSERSKAATIYTTGYICAVLDISIDTVFGIENELSSAEEVEFVRQLSELKVDLRLKEQEIEHLHQALDEKDARISEAHTAIEHYRKESDINIKKVQPWVFIVVLVLLICMSVFIVTYLLVFDVRNPEYGLFKKDLFFAGISNAPCSFLTFLPR